MSEGQANEALHQFLLERAEETTNRWLLSSKENKENPYVTNASMDRMLKDMKRSFSIEMIYMFKEEEPTFLDRFHQQAEKLAEEHDEIWQLYWTIQQEFVQYRTILLEQIEAFVAQYESFIPNEHVMAWNSKVLRLLDYASSTFMQEAFRQIDREMKEQEHLITTLTAPVIRIEKQTGLLSLIGEIEIKRGQAIIEQTLQQCQELGISTLLIDFSGVDHIDSSVVDHIQTLVKGLKLLGVKTTLSGIKPILVKDTLLFEKAFQHVSITKNLEAAIRSVYYE